MGILQLPNGIIGEQTTIEAIIDRVHKRQDTWQTIPRVPLPNPLELKETAILGAFSYALQESKSRLVRADLLVSVNGTAETPPALARDYLMLKFTKAERIKHVQLIRLKAGYRDFPVLAKPQTFDEGFYVDIRSAFWSIMEVIGWRVDYYPGKWLMRGQGVRDFPFQGVERQQKIARHALVSAGALTEMSQWRPKERKIVSVKGGNPLVNSQLIGLVHDVLSAIAFQARQLGAIYTATDGHICPDQQSLKKVVQLVADWGLEARVKAYGPGEVRGAGAYTVGPARSKSPAMGRISNLKKGEYDAWLQPRFARLAAIKHLED
jgi:hypothetical protein